MLRNTLFAGAALLALGLGSGAARADITIGVAGPMTGQYAAFGQQMKEGAQQAVDDINAKGGVLGQKLAIEFGDDACDPRQAVSVANKFANDGIKFVDGHFCSGSSIPASKVYADEGILEITPASTNPAFTDNGSWNTFRTCGRDDQQGKVAGDFLAKNYKNDKIAILDDNSAYGKGLADETRKNLNADGVKEAMDEHYTAGEHDYSALVSRMKQAGIQVVYIGGYHTETGLIARQAKEQGMNITLVGGDALVTSEYWQIAGDAGNGTIMTFPADPRTKPTAAAVVAEYKAKNIDPEGYVLYTYAAIQVWTEAVTKAGTTDPHKVADTLKANQDGWDSVLGKISYDSKGDPKEGGYVLYVWKNGSYAEM
jgi:branched-chain amino acid transport system substrate-binding protein